MRAAIMTFLAATVLVTAVGAGAGTATGAGGVDTATGAGERSAPPPSGAVLPVEGPVTREFVAPAHPFGPGHRGVDLAAEPATTVRAALPGVVTFAGEVARRGWVTVDHGGGLDTTYGVLDPRLVTAGQHVEAGTPLGRLAVDANHLDWGARLHGEYIDPLRLLSRWLPHLVRLPR